MSEELSPYASPSHAVDVPAMPPARVPGQIKVLGILHLVLAGLGLVMILFTSVSQKWTESMMAAQEKAGGFQAAQAQISRAIVEASELITWFGYASALILGVMLFLAGLALLKRKKAGLAWSNRYAWTSILFKVVCLILFVTVTLPKINGVFATLGNGDRQMETFGSIMRMSTIGSGIAGPLVSCIYPVLVLILLNRESVRKSLI